MEFHLDKAMKAMSIEEEEDKPLVLTNQPRLCYSERNVLSIMGRFLNPECQKMSNWILICHEYGDYTIVRGVTLSQDRFQFIFKSENDLNTVLKAGGWTQNNWCVVMERWVEDPPNDYLMILPIWIRLRNILVNHYTEDTIKEIAEQDKSQGKDYVRVRVLFDVSRPLKNSKAVQLPNGTMVSIGIDYERVSKRCFQCQRLTHDKPRCPRNPLNWHLNWQQHATERVVQGTTDGKARSCSSN